MTALIWCPFPDETSARATADRLLEEGLIACANLVPGMISLFVWRGEREEACEVGALFKTAGEKLDSAIMRIEALHPYESPAILGWLCDGANESTRAWVTQTGSNEG